MISQKTSPTQNWAIEHSDDGGQVDGEQHLAAELVGEPATEEGAQEDADQRRGAYQPFLGRRHAELGADLHQGHTDDGQHVAV